MIIMIFVGLAIIFFVAAMGVYFLIRKKKSNYQNVKKETIIFSALMVFSILFVLANFFVPIGAPSYDLNSISPILEQEIKEVNEGIISVYGVVINPPQECGEKYCFDLQIVDSQESGLATDSIINVKTDCELDYSSIIQISGQYDEGTIKADCSEIIPFMEMVEAPQ
jgi:amino acid transporter